MGIKVGSGLWWDEIYKKQEKRRPYIAPAVELPAIYAHFSDYDKADLGDVVILRSGKIYVWGATVYTERDVARAKARFTKAGYHVRTTNSGFFGFSVYFGRK